MFLCPLILLSPVGLLVEVRLVVVVADDLARLGAVQLEIFEKKIDTLFNCFVGNLRHLFGYYRVELLGREEELESEPVGDHGHHEEGEEEGQSGRFHGLKWYLKKKKLVGKFLLIIIINYHIIMTYKTCIFRGEINTPVWCTERTKNLPKTKSTILLGK